MRVLRMTPRLPRLTLPTLLLLSLGVLGCPGPGSGGGTPDSGVPEGDTTPPTNVQVTGGVSMGETVSTPRTLQATAQDDSGMVAKVEFFVDTTLACADTTTKASGATFSCAWNPTTLSQGAHQLTAKATDAAGNSASSTPITFNAPAPNRVPAIDKVTATPSSVDEGSNVALSVTASDPDGDAISYAWSQSPAAPAGSFTGSGATRTWTAPILSQDTTFTLKVTVTDARGGTAEATTDVQVKNNPALNHKPVVAPLTAPSAAIAGDNITLTANASDDDGDPLTYTWTVTTSAGPAGGTLTNETTSSVTWRSGDLSAATTYTFTITVSDGTDSATQSTTATVNVPTYARDIQPVWSVCTTCHTGSPGRGSLTLDADKSYASLVNTPGAGTGCSTYTRVKPGDPDHSLVYLKMTGTPCGSRMPLNNPTYFDSNPGLVTRVRSWILASAPNN